MPEKTRRSVILMSGGMDSTVLFYWALERGYDPYPTFISYGQHCGRIELSTLQSILPSQHRERLHVVEVSALYERSASRLISEANLWVDTVASENLYLPYRNLLLLTIGAACAATHGLDYVLAGFINSNHALEIDATFDFLERVRTLTEGVGGVKIHFPFRDRSKAEVAEIGHSLGVPIASTYSCQINSRTHCGVCPNCVDRLDAFETLSRRHSERP